MSRDLRIALKVADRGLARQILECVTRLAGVKIVDRSGTAPDVLLLEDGGGEGIAREVAHLRDASPSTEVMVLSGNGRPDHIIEVMKAGAAELFLKPLDPERLREAVEAAQLRVVAGRRPAHGTVYGFMGSKGGVGATALAVNAAVALAQAGKGEVALLDASLQSGDGSVFLDVVADTTVADLCRSFHRLDAALLKGGMTHHQTGVSFLPAPAAPEESEAVRGEHLVRLLELARGLYAHTVVDCGPLSVDERSVELLRAADRFFVVIDLSVPAIRNAARLIRLVEKQALARQPVQVLVNRYIGGSVPSLAEVEKSLGRRASWLFPNDYRSVVTSINQGVPVVKGQPQSHFAKSVKEFVVHQLGGEAGKGSFRGARGLFGRAV